MPRKPLTKDIINERLQGRGIVMLDEYQKQTIKVSFQCKCGNRWAARPNNVLSGKGCPKCGIAARAKKAKIPLEQIQERLTKKGIKLIGKYLNTQTKTEFQCDSGHTWSTTLSAVLNRTGCPHCYEKNTPLSKGVVNERIKKRGLSLTGEYLGAHRKTNFQCSVGHTWQATPANAIHLERGCPHCAGQFPLTKEIVNERISNRELKLVGSYTNNLTKTLFKCNKGHFWKSSAANVMSGTGCPFCAGNLSLTTDIVNERLADRNIVMLDTYVNNATKARFRGECGHIWRTAPANTLSGRGCPECAERTSDNDTFYIWQAELQELVDLGEDEFLVKFGVTSERRGIIRIKEVAYQWDCKPKVLAIVKTKNQANWVEHLVRSIGKRLPEQYSSLDGWTEFRIVTKEELGLMSAIADSAAAYRIAWNQGDPVKYSGLVEQLRLYLE